MKYVYIVMKNDTREVEKSISDVLTSLTKARGYLGEKSREEIFEIQNDKENKLVDYCVQTDYHIVESLNYTVTYRVEKHQVI